MASVTLPADANDKSVDVEYSSADGLMAHGPDALHQHVATKIEAALGRAMPQMDVRFRNLSLSADIVVTEADGSKFELPTLLNTVKKAFSGPKKRVVHKEILRNVSGTFRPGTLTLLLGQPGSGKSALMKVLSGRFPMTKNITLEGSVTYNNVPRKDIVKILPQFVAYVNQRDKHLPTLTVKETLEFAHKFTGGEFSRRGEELLSNGTPEDNERALAAAKAMFENYPDLIIRQLGLTICQNTIVGDAMIRGISGGERKRVTTGEMEFGMKYMTLMDEISTGLDSAATFDIISTQRGIAQKLRKTVVIALLQPAPEVLALFDDVMILNEGELMYHGPVKAVESYFESLGFCRPPGRDLADYLLDLGTDEQYRYETEGSGSYLRTASQFAELFRQSFIFDCTLNALETPDSAELLRNVEDHMEKTPKFHQPFWPSLLTLIQRQLMVTYRNTPFIAGRIVMITVMGLLCCTTFYQFDPKQISVVMGVIFMTILFLSIGQASQVPTIMAERDVFYKQRGANFFRTSGYVLASSISMIPLALVETLVFGSLIYWVSGFASNIGRFVIFEIVLLLSNLTMGMWFFFVTVLSPNTSVATPASLTTVLIFVIFAGFVVTKDQIPDYLVWAHWLSPLAWSFRALAINQYRANPFDVCVYEDVDYCSAYGVTMGEYYLSLFGIELNEEWIAYGVIYIVGMYMLFTFITFLTLEYYRYETPEVIDLREHQANEPKEGYNLVTTPKPSSFEDDKHIILVEGPNRSFVPVTIAFQDVWYSVPDPKDSKNTLDLLKGISGFAKPGTMTALMGSSGAGKTTLMDVIAGRKTGGTIDGKILLNGYPATDLSIRRCTGYCEQMDIHSEAATIREALTFSSFLRQDSSIPDSKKFDSVEECLDLLGLQDIADQIIRGSSVEQMKRLTIGVELAAQPSIIFMDEPTSGLDARSARLIMDGVRKVADSGRTVVCTIHQPSADVFFLFDSLLLLKRGGETVFFGDLGPNCCNVINYFEAVPGVLPFSEGMNPATWMLDCIGAGVDSGASATASIDFAAKFESSLLKSLLDESLREDGVATPSTTYSEIVFTEKRAADSKTQLKFLLQRFFRMYWRTPTYNLTRFAASIFLALLFGVIFVNSDYASYQGLNSGAGMVFLAAFFNAMLSYQSVLPLASTERASFYRERATQTYNAFYYWLGSSVVEIPYIAASSAMFTAIFFPMVGFTGVKTGVLFWLAQTLLTLMQTYMGHACSYAFPSEEVANIVGVLIVAVFGIFMGFAPPAYAIPSGYKWLYDIAPMRFPLSILVALVFSDCDDPPTWNEELQQYDNVGSQLGCQPMKNAPQTVGHITLKGYMEQYFYMKHDDITAHYIIVLGYIGLFLVLSLLALRYINHQKK